MSSAHINWSVWYDEGKLEWNARAELLGETAEGVKTLRTVPSWEGEYAQTLVTRDDAMTWLTRVQYVLSPLGQEWSRAQYEGDTTTKGTVML